MADEWRANLVDDDEGIRRILRETRRIAVLGIKPETHAGQPAHYVPKALLAEGYEIAPVPTYYPAVTAILGRPVVRRLADVSPPADLVDVFRRPEDVPAHLDDILAARPKAVWLQSGIRHAEAAERLARAGIRVVQDRCLMVEERRLRAAR
jgi:hypothetical protein